MQDYDVLPSQSNRMPIPQRQPADMLDIKSQLISRVEYSQSKSRGVTKITYSSKLTPHMRPQQVQINRLQLRTSQNQNDNVDVPSAWNLVNSNGAIPLSLPRIPNVQGLVIDLNDLHKQTKQSLKK